MEITEQEVKIQATIMAIREVLMEYFKGTCVERFTKETNVSLVNIGGATIDFQYQRREHENKRPAVVKLGDLPLISVERSPDKLVFHATILNRSPQLKQVYKELQSFMDRYLVGVAVSHSQKGVFYAN